MVMIDRLGSTAGKACACMQLASFLPYQRFLNLITTLLC
jgi:hypothetical protein